MTASQVISLEPSSFVSNFRVKVPSSFLTISFGVEPGCTLTPFWLICSVRNLRHCSQSRGVNRAALL